MSGEAGTAVMGHSKLRGRDCGCCCSSGSDGRDGASSGANEAPGAGLEPHLPSVKDCSL